MYDRNGHELFVGNHVFDIYSGESGNILAEDDGVAGVKIEFLDGVDYCPTSDLEFEQDEPKEIISLLGVPDWD